MKAMTNTNNKQANKETLRQRKSVCNHEQQKKTTLKKIRQAMERRWWKGVFFEWVCSLARIIMNAADVRELKTKRYPI
ncbi:hypothetical protein P5673_005743 [Acropora cervicornis]|uniref:Uncharacterized protein n=1 Tax=Acropora cervicornis TaxID=6130 RepID=A0AAD9QYJ0_ACRCE|nr:hypothetical protein P5673_005743 [Acropora cervicornis]